MLDLEPIKARLAAATPWPWTWTHPDSDGGLVSETEKDGETSDYDGRWIEYPAVVLMHGSESDADDALIANAPKDLAVLVAEVERLTQEPHWQTVAEERAATIDALEAEVERLRRFENIVRERARIDEHGSVGDFCRGVLRAIGAGPTAPSHAKDEPLPYLHKHDPACPDCTDDGPCYDHRSVGRYDKAKAENEGKGQWLDEAAYLADEAGRLEVWREQRASRAKGGSGDEG